MKYVNKKRVIVPLYDNRRRERANYVTLLHLRTGQKILTESGPTKWLD